LVLEVVDKFAVLSVFAGENLLKLEDWTDRRVSVWVSFSSNRTDYQRIYCYGTVTLEYICDRGENLIPNDHVLSLPYSSDELSSFSSCGRRRTVFGALGRLELE